MIEAAKAFPLSWPSGWERAQKRANGPFKRSLDAARRIVSMEVKRLGGTDVVISTNLPLRKDGMPYASGVMKINDPGVAVYFNFKDKPMCFACDKYHHLQDNMTAIAKTIEALRGIERWGASDMMERAFSGFKALPETASETQENWRIVLQIPDNVVPRFEDVQQQYRYLLKLVHPDYGGERAAFDRLQKAWAEAKKEMGA